MANQNDLDPEVLDHEYDGIREFDNPLPAWWLATFGATVIFAFLYWIDAETAGRPTQVQVAESEIAAFKQLQPAVQNDPAGEEGFDQYALVAGNLDKGRTVYGAKCAVCHGPEGQGSIGPNLTDEFWIHGKGGYSDVAKVVRTGVPEKGMPNWEALLSSDDIKSVTVFVVGLKGSQPPNGKAPQGEKVTR